MLKSFQVKSYSALIRVVFEEREFDNRSDSGKKKKRYQVEMHPAPLFAKSVHTRNAG